MSKEPNPPSICSPRFDCPYCGAFSHQDWYKLNADLIQNSEQWESIVENITDKNIITVVQKQSPSGTINDANNLFLSQCYSCKKAAIWVYSGIVFPPQRFGVEPNQDIPPEIISDIEEARTIVDLSPRGAAALMRLALDKLCNHLEGKGKIISDKIQSLVSKGLANPPAQQSLDFVRVVGNEAVHPGKLDLKDDKATVAQLFYMINIIAEQMITVKKSVQEAYNKIPESKRNAIDVRDGRATGGTKPDTPSKQG